MINYKHFSYNEEIYKFILGLPNIKKNILNSDLTSLSICICPLYLNKKDVQGTIYIPQTTLENKDFVRRIAHTFDFNLFHNTIEKLSIKNDASNLLEEHLKFCDKLIADIIPENNYIKDIEYYEAIDSEFIYTSITDEKSLKDLVINTTISRYFQTGPYNFLIDLKSFLDHINDDNRISKYSFPNKDLYTKIVHYEDYSLQELINLYYSLKDSHIMEEFYDDWNLAKDEFVEELNSKIITHNNMPPKDKKLSKVFGIDIYNLKTSDYYLLIHDTSIKPDNKRGIQLIKKNKGVFGRTCLSVQDQNHIISFSGSLGVELSSSIKLVFEHLDSRFLTFIYPEDAFSTSLNHSDSFYNTPRKIFPLKTLMDYTNNNEYNELTYYTSTTDENGIEETKSPLLPIAILCEDDISHDEVLVANILKVPIIFRKTNELLQSKAKNKNKGFYPIKYRHPN